MSRARNRVKAVRSWSGEIFRRGDRVEIIRSLLHDGMVGKTGTVTGFEKTGMVWVQWHGDDGRHKSMMGPGNLRLIEETD